MNPLDKYIVEGLLRNRAGGKGLSDEIKKEIIEKYICLEHGPLSKRNYKFTDEGLELSNGDLHSMVEIYIVAPQSIISSLNISKLTGVQLNIGRFWGQNRFWREDSKKITSLEGLFAPNFTMDDYRYHCQIRLNNLGIKNLKGLPEIKKLYGTCDLIIRRCNDIITYDDIPDSYKKIAIYLDRSQYTYEDAKNLQEELGALYEKKGGLVYVDRIKF